MFPDGVQQFSPLFLQQKLLITYIHYNLKFLGSLAKRSLTTPSGNLVFNILEPIFRKGEIPGEILINDIYS